jgi:ribosome-binding factor A
MLASVVRETIAPSLRECPRECGIVSITEVEVSPDYSYATVSISALKETAMAVKFLEERRGRLQGLIGKQLAVRKVPVLRFRIDRSIERADRVDELLRNADKEKPDDSSTGSQDEVR